MLESRGRGILDAPPSRGMTMKFGERIRVHILAARCVRALHLVSPSHRTEGAGKAGCWLHPWVPCNKKHGGRTTGSTEAFRLSLRDGVTVSSALSLVTGLSCHHHPRQLLLLANLAPASGRQDHTASPSAAVAFVCRNNSVHGISPQRS